MPVETILVVEDSPVSLKILSAVLRAEGYKVQIASTAEQAWSILRFLKPELVLLDMFLPGMSGMELAVKIKREPRLKGVLVVVLSAFDAQRGEEQARAAECDGFLAKPIDGPTLVARIGRFLRKGEEAPAAIETAAVLEDEPALQAYSFGLSEASLHDLRKSFLNQAAAGIQPLLASLDSGFDAPAAMRLLRQWSSAAGLLGLPLICEQSREAEARIRTPNRNIGAIEEALRKLNAEFNNRNSAYPEAPVPEAIAQALQGKRIGLIGVGDWEAERLCGALERVSAKPRLFAADDSPEKESIRDCSALVIHVRQETEGSPWLAAQFTPPPGLPLVLLGRRDSLLSLESGVQARAAEFLIDGWQAEEALLRLHMALSRTSPFAPRLHSGAETGSQPGLVAAQDEAVVIADDDVTVRTLVDAALKSYGWRRLVAANGSDALDLIRKHRPRGAVLDVNMPGIDGFEVLAAVRREDIPVRVVLLTARNHELDILRAFALGCDDYMVKPFRPMELVVRLKRLLV